MTAKLKINRDSNLNKVTLRNGDYLVLLNKEHDYEYLCIYSSKSKICVDILEGNVFNVSNNNVFVDETTFDGSVLGICILKEVILSEQVDIEFNITKVI